MKQVSIGDGLSLTVQGKEQQEVVRDVAQYYFRLRILANASAKAGNYEWESKVEKDSKVIFAPLDVNLDYADFAFRSTIMQPGMHGSSGAGSRRGTSTPVASCATT